MLSTGRTEDEEGYKSLLAGDFNGLKRNAKRKRTNVKQTRSESGPCPPLGQIGKRKLA
jgi:hypothetical protein